MNTTTDMLSAATVQYENGVLTMTRFYAAPRELLFRMWTDASHFVNWFGPRGGSVPHCTVDLRPGGSMLFCIEVPKRDDSFSGERVWGKWVFREVVEPERIVFGGCFSDENGNIVERPGFARETVISVFFEEHDGGTKITLRHELEVEQGEIDGWTECFDRLGEYLQSLQKG